MDIVERYCCYRPMLSLFQVKSQCYCTLPVQFRPVTSGHFTASIAMRTAGKILTARLVGAAS